MLVYDKDILSGKLDRKKFFWYQIFEHFDENLAPFLTLNMNLTSSILFSA